MFMMKGMWGFFFFNGWRSGTYALRDRWRTFTLDSLGGNFFFRCTGVEMRKMPNKLRDTQIHSEAENRDRMKNQRVSRDVESCGNERNYWEFFRTGDKFAIPTDNGFLNLIFSDNAFFFFFGISRLCPGRLLWSLLLLQKLTVTPKRMHWSTRNSRLSGGIVAPGDVEGIKASACV
jgi:hypothetical protein